MDRSIRAGGVGGEDRAGQDGVVADAEAVVQSEPAGRRREDRIVGASEATRRLIAEASAAARSDLPVWLVAPRGSDEELVARAIHAWGPRSALPLEVLTCAAIPEALQGRELFGCAEGVYPAVPGEHVGALERAARTTLLLEGVERLRADARAALLRALALRAFRREGEARDRKLDARVVIATEQEPPPELAERPWHVIRIRPLRERREDVIPLATHFLRAFSEEAGVTAVGFTADARAYLEEETWSGDVLELRARIREAVRLAGSGAVGPEALMLANVEVPSFKEAKRAFETRYVVGLLRRCGGNISRAARLAKKDRKDFYDVIRRTGIDPESFRD
jgi:two-component system response regulator GlrR